MRLFLQLFAEGEPAQGTEPTAQQQTQTPAADGKTFTQAEVEQIVKDRLARQGKPPTTQTTQAAQATQPGTEQTQTTNDASAALAEQLEVMRSGMVLAEVKAAMPINDIQPDKVARAARLVDLTKCVDDKGMPDAAKIKAEITDLLKDFPELKNATTEAVNGFKIGASTTQSSAGGQDAISKIFGNKKG